MNAGHRRRVLQVQLDGAIDSGQHRRAAEIGGREIFAHEPGLACGRAQIRFGDDQRHALGDHRTLRIAHAFITEQTPQPDQRRHRRNRCAVVVGSQHRERVGGRTDNRDSRVGFER